MEEEIKDLLNEEIASAINTLSQFEQGSEEHTAAVDNLTKLYKLRIEENKNEHEELLKKKQLREQVLERYFKIGAEVTINAAMMIFYAHWMRKGFKFEETGTYTSSTFKGLFQKFKPANKS